MYFDAVLDFDMEPLFNGTPAETKNWIADNAYELTRRHPKARVCIGRTLAMVEIDEYMKR
jgi:hypothetical protein